MGLRSIALSVLTIGMGVFAPIPAMPPLSTLFPLSNLTSEMSPPSQERSKIDQSSVAQRAPAPSPNLPLLEQQILVEQNRVRQNPRSYIPLMENWLARMDSQGRVRMNANTILVTQEGRKAVQEAIAFLRRQPAVGSLQTVSGLGKAAKAHAHDQKNGQTGHTGSDGSRSADRGKRYGQTYGCCGENIAYGPDTAQGVIMGLIIDDGVRDRGHRTTIFDPVYRVSGAGCGPHRTYGIVCVINYAVGYLDGRTAPVPKLAFSVANQSPETVVGIYRTPSSLNRWGQNLLKSSDSVGPRYRITLTTDGVIEGTQQICSFNLRAVTAKGREQVAKGINLCRGPYTLSVR